MLTQNGAVVIHDLARFRRARAQFFDHLGIVAIGHKTNVLAVGFVRQRQPVFACQFAGLFLGRVMAQREPQIIELFWRGREQEIALVLGRVGGAMQFRPLIAHHPLNVVTGRHAVGVQIARGFQQVLELDPFVTADAGHRCRPSQIAVGEFINHGILKDVFVIKHVMGEAHFLGHAAGIVNITARATGAFLGQRRAMIVELQRHAHNVVPLFGQHCRHNRTVHAAGHGDNHTGFAGRLGKTKRIKFGIAWHRGLLRDDHLGSLTEYMKMRRTLKGPFHRQLSPKDQFDHIHRLTWGKKCICERSKAHAQRDCQTDRR